MLDLGQTIEVEARVTAATVAISQAEPELRIKMLANETLDHTIAVVTLGVQTIIQYRPIDVLRSSATEFTRDVLLCIEQARFAASAPGAVSPHPWFGALRGAA